MDCISPMRIQKGLDPSVHPHGVTVPCGKCMMCRIAKRREWTLRLTHELASSQDGIFITLTYDDENLPRKNPTREIPNPFPTVVKSDLQKYFKRLRKAIGEKKIKYFACGEYGDLNERPHYHAIVSNMSILSDSDCNAVTDCWSKGFTHIGIAEFDSIQYVAGYIEKKLTGPLGKKYYQDLGRDPVFRLVSQGIGKEYALKHRDQLSQNLYSSIKGKKMNLPRYYVDVLQLDPADLSTRSQDKERAELFDLIGMNITKNELLFEGEGQDKLIVFDRDRKIAKQKQKNLNAKLGVKKKRKL